MPRGRHAGNGNNGDDGRIDWRAAEKRVRKQDRRHKCHARCEHAREVVGNAAQGCSCLPLVVGVVLAILVAIMAVTGKL